MRLYTVSSIDEWIMMRGPKGATVPRLGKNGGPLSKTDGMISSLENCVQFVRNKRATFSVSTSKIRKWKGQ